MDVDRLVPDGDDLLCLYTLIVAIFDSLWPVIALHVLVDLADGVIAWLVLREGSARGAE